MKTYKNMSNQRHNHHDKKNNAQQEPEEKVLHGHKKAEPDEHKKHQKHEKEHEHSGGDHEHQGHEGHHEHMLDDFKKRFWISLIITIPILLLSEMIQMWFGFEIGFPGSEYVLGALGTLIYFYGGWPFLKGLVDEIKSKAPGMMTLIAAAITVAWAYSLAITSGLEGMDFYWELSTLIVVMLLGHWLEMKSEMGASKWRSRFFQDEVVVGLIFWSILKN